jgi:AcrR family transcriptional regulator
MPRVTDEHRERRRNQILHAARRCFIRQGFHQTSMADIFAEAGLSAGAVYGYFKSKNDLIAAIAAQAIDEVAGTIAPIASEDPVPSLDVVIGQGLRATEAFAFGVDGFARLAPQVWAEAAHDPVLREVLRDKYATIHAMLTQLVIAQQKTGRVRPDGDPEAAARVLVSAVMGYILQRLLMGTVDPDSYASGLATLMPTHGPD